MKGQIIFFFEQNDIRARSLFEHGHCRGKANNAAAYDADVVNHCDTHSQLIEVNAERKLGVFGDSLIVRAPESRANPTSRTCGRAGPQPWDAKYLP
jgi:hypothetical protein